MVLEDDPDHAARVGQPGAPAQPGLGACGDGRPGQHGGRPVPGRGQGLEARVDGLHGRAPGVVGAWLRAARPVNDLQGGQFLQADGAAAGRGVGGRHPHLRLELSDGHHL